MPESFDDHVLTLPQEKGFAWCAGEAPVTAQLSDILASGKGLPKEAMRVSAYWENGASSYRQDLE